MRELPEHSHAGSRDIAELRSNRGADRQEEIDARAEANDSHSVALPDALTELSERELEVLWEMAEGKSNSSLAGVASGRWCNSWGSGSLSRAS